MCIVHNAQCALCTMHNVHCAQCTMFIVHNAQCSLFTMHSVHCAQCTMCIVHNWHNWRNWHNWHNCTSSLSAQFRDPKSLGARHIARKKLASDGSKCKMSFSKKMRFDCENSMFFARCWWKSQNEIIHLRSFWVEHFARGSRGRSVFSKRVSRKVAGKGPKKTKNGPIRTSARGFGGL